MALFKRKTHQAHVSIRLASNSKDGHLFTNQDHFLTNETIHGHANIQLPLGAEFSHCKITLKGSVKTTTEDTSPGALGKRWRSEQLPFLGVKYSGNGRQHVKNDDGSVRVPFHFNISTSERLASFISELPPSLDSRLEGQRTSDGQYEIAYSITATAFSTRSTTLAAGTQKIFIHPVSPDALSAHHSEAPNEYHWAEPVSLSKPRMHRLNSSGSSSPAGPRIEIAGQEPDSLVFNLEDMPCEGMTEVPFVVKLCPPNNGEIDETLLPTQCLVKAQLVTKTHITPDGLKQIGSKLEFMRTGGNHVNRVQSGYEQDELCPISRWESCTSSTTDPFSVARFTFLYNIRNEKPPTPTFFTPLLSRRYFLDLSLSFPERPHEIFKMTLPVEMVHSTLDGLSDDERKKSRASSPGMATPL